MLLTICALVIYVVMTICASIPICIVAKTSSVKDRNFSQSTERIISFCNCMAGGVFIAMCFLGLLPYAKDKTAVVLSDLKAKTDFPVAEFVVVLGFFLIMVIEQSIMQCQDKKKQEKIRQEMWNSSTRSAVPSAQADKQQQNYFASNSSSNNTEEDDESCTQLLADSPIALEVVSPESPSVPLTRQIQMAPLYQNVPMVILRGQNLDCKPPIRPADSLEDQNTSMQHCHSRHIETLATKPHLLRFMLLYLSVSIHSVFEGMALGLQADRMRIFHLFFAIIFHEALVGLSVGITMARQQFTLMRSVKYVLLFSLSVPVGILIGLVVQQTPGTGGAIASAILQSLATGIFIHVTFLELVPSEFHNQKDRLAKVAFHFLGFLSLAVVTVTMGSHH